MSQETLNELLDEAVEEMTDFEKKCQQYKKCSRCGCPTDESEFEYKECVTDEDFLSNQYHWKDCVKMLPYEPDNQD